LPLHHLWLVALTFFAAKIWASKVKSTEFTVSPILAMLVRSGHSYNPADCPLAQISNYSTAATSKPSTSYDQAVVRHRSFQAQQCPLGYPGILAVSGGRSQAADSGSLPFRSSPFPLPAQLIIHPPAFRSHVKLVVRC
jgi:hypothetical protein